MDRVKNYKLNELIKLWKKQFKFRFKDKSLLVQALTHDSYIRKKNKKDLSNEKLEFLGDAVLGLVVCNYLYEKFDNLEVGQLSKIKSHLVSGSLLIQIGEKIKLGNYLFLSPGEEAEGGRKKPSIVADAVEAVIGAIYLDQGISKAREFILYHFQDFLKSISLKGLDHKTTLQEFIQKKHKKLPYYKVVRELGPPHQKTFDINIVFGNKILGKGRGKSKKEAEQLAAEKALKKLKLI